MAHACVIAELPGSTAEVHCWGANIFNSTAITVPKNLSNVRLITASEVTTCVTGTLPNDPNEVHCWGWDGVTAPVPRATRQNSPPAGLKNVRVLAAGYDTVCAVGELPGSSDEVHCWGLDSYGLLSKKPAGLRNVRQLISSHVHICAVGDRDGFPGEEVHCWGYNGDGQTNVPAGLKNVRQIASEGYHTCVLDDTGLHCWGMNAKGNTVSPADLPEPHFIAVSDGSTCTVLKVDNIGNPVRCWGNGVALPETLFSFSKRAASAMSFNGSPIAAGYPAPHSAKPAKSGQSLTLAIEIAGFAPTGTVTFKEGATILGSNSVKYNPGTNTFYSVYSTNTLNVGTHAITAEYSGDIYNTASSGTLIQVVNP